jgi:hypothetical protein
MYDVLRIAYAAAFFIFLVIVVVLSRRARRRGSSARNAFVGAIYEMQNQDKQRALDVIVKGKAAETRPEYPDGDLPQLEHPKPEPPKREE